VAGEKVLVVDDDPFIINLVVYNLEQEGYTIIQANNGLEALEKARHEKPDLIVLDIMLPKMDGYKVSRILKFDKNYKNIPVLMLTAKAQDDDKQIGMETGADIYMTKPFEPEVLVKKVKDLLAKRKELDK
jgi:two-component system, OmpR family, alkaline phosphatase synthesis response regulator PhoP